jgi:hypothetical protein
LVDELEAKVAESLEDKDPELVEDKDPELFVHADKIKTNKNATLNLLNTIILILP